MRFFNTLLDAVFPANCLSCGASGEVFCANCLREAPPSERESPKWIFPLCDYRNPGVRSALRLYKYGGKKRLARVFAEALHGKITEELSGLGPLEGFLSPLLVPIPLSKKRYRERGYNQAELISIELVKIDRERKSTGLHLMTAANVLIKGRETENQARIKSRTERLKNLRGSFSIRRREAEKIKGKNIILIDDITTTGATLSEARKALKEAGARKVIAFTVAH